MKQPLHTILMTTASTKTEARKLAEIVLEHKLAACVQIFPIESFYKWNRTLRHDKEYLLLIKTKTAHFKKLEECIRQHHSYEVPEIIEVPITNGSTKYLQWLDKNTKI